jgi:hypothetical protein
MASDHLSNSKLSARSGCEAPTVVIRLSNAFI